MGGGSGCVSVDVGSDRPAEIGADGANPDHSERCRCSKDLSVIGPAKASPPVVLQSETRVRLVGLEIQASPVCSFLRPGVVQSEVPLPLLLEKISARRRGPL